MRSGVVSCSWGHPARRCSLSSSQVRDGPALLLSKSSRGGNSGPGAVGGSITLRQASKDLADLLDLVGLLREVGGQPEGGEESFGIEEGVDP